MPEYDGGKARYIELAEELEEEIRYGVYTPGGRLPSIRDMAARKKVSESTILRAYQLLEHMDIIYRVSTWGYFVKKSGNMPRSVSF